MRLRQIGIGIVEILIVVSISAVVGLAILGIITSSNSVFIDQTIQVNQGLSANTASREISDLIRSSAGVVSAYPVTGPPTYTASADVLVLKIPSVNAAGQIIDSVFDYAVVLKEPADSELLRMHVFPDNQSFRQSENTVLSTELKSVKFFYLDSNNSQVSPSQAIRVNFIINLVEETGFNRNESSASGVVNIKN